jgi:hypothetical protein
MRVEQAQARPVHAATLQQHMGKMVAVGAHCDDHGSVTVLG